MVETLAELGFLEVGSGCWEVVGTCSQRSHQNACVARPAHGLDIPTPVIVSGRWARVNILHMFSVAIDITVSNQVYPDVEQSSK